MLYSRWGFAVRFAARRGRATLVAARLRTMIDAYYAARAIRPDGRRG
jgi:hypothetical protein